MNNKSINNISLFLLTIIAFLLPALWLKEGLVIAYVESGYSIFLISPLKMLKIAPYVWQYGRDLGFFDYFSPIYLFYYFLMSCLEFIGFSAVLRQYFVFSITLMGSGVFMYFLAKKLFQFSEKEFSDKKSIMSILCALFYMLNPFVMTYVWHRFTPAIFGLPFVPLIFLCILNILNNPNLKNSLLLAIIFTVFSLNIFSANFFGALYLQFFLFLLFFSKSPKLWRYIALGVVLMLGLSLWLTLPFFAISKQLNISSNIINSDFTLKSISQSVSLLNIFRLFDKEHSQWLGVNYHPGMMEFIIPGLALLGILKYKKNKIIWFFSLLLAIGLFLSKGLQPPGGSIFYFFFAHIKYLQIFRNPIEKSGLLIVFSYCFLISIGIIYLTSFLKNKAIKIGIFSAIVFLLLYASIWPMWSNKLFSFTVDQIPGKVQQAPAVNIKIPLYWQSAEDFLSKDKSLSRILFLPQSWLDAMVYKWKYGYFGADGIYLEMPNKGTVNMFMYNPLVEKLRTLSMNNFYNNKENIYLSLFGLMNISEILIRNDVDTVASKTVPLKKINQVIKNSKQLNKQISFGPLDLYKLPDKYILPHFYVPTKILYLQSEIKDLPDLLNLKDLESRMGIYIDNNFNENFNARSDEVYIKKFSPNKLFTNLLSSNQWQEFSDTSMFQNLNNKKIFFKDIANWQPDTDFLLKGLVNSDNEPATLLIAEKELNNDWHVLQQLSIQNSSLQELKFDYHSYPYVAEAKLLLVVNSNKVLEKIQFQNLNLINLEENNDLYKQDNNHQQSLTKQIPQIIFQRINPTKYLIQVNNAKAPYNLVFNETFNADWKLYLRQNTKLDFQSKDNNDAIIASYFNGDIREKLHKNIFFDKNLLETWFKKPIADNKHYLVNGYANSWQIDKEDVKGKENYELVLEFAPQRLVYAGIFISVLTLITSLLILIILRFKKNG